MSPGAVTAETGVVCSQVGGTLELEGRRDKGNVADANVGFVDVVFSKHGGGCEIWLEEICKA